MTAQVLQLADYRLDPIPPAQSETEPNFVCEECAGNLMQVLPEGIFCNHCDTEYKPFG